MCQGSVNWFEGGLSRGRNRRLAHRFQPAGRSPPGGFAVGPSSPERGEAAGGEPPVWPSAVRRLGWRRWRPGRYTRRERSRSAPVRAGRGGARTGRFHAHVHDRDDPGGRHRQGGRKMLKFLGVNTIFRKGVINTHISDIR